MKKAFITLTIMNVIVLGIAVFAVHPLLGEQVSAVSTYIGLAFVVYCCIGELFFKSLVGKDIRGTYFVWFFLTVIMALIIIFIVYMVTTGIIGLFI